MVCFILAATTNLIGDTALIIELIILAILSYIFRSKDKKLHR